MSEAAPAAGEAAKKKRPLLRRIPTSLLVTLLGIGLTAWLLPALSRQWDDRQQAHELQAALVSKMALASAKAFVAGHNAMLVRQSPEPAGRPGEEQWAIESFEIESRLRAYFSPAIVGSWNRYRTLLSGALDTSYHRQSLLAISGGGPKPRRPYPAATFDLNQLQIVLSGDRDRFHAYAVNSPAFGRWGPLEYDLARLENQVARAVLAASPKGYSTTLGDFLHDLVP
jgi:hypothetical protein